MEHLRRAADLGGKRLQRRAQRTRRLHPAQRAMPLDQRAHGACGQRQHRRLGGHRQAPQRKLGPGQPVIEPGQTVVAARIPIRGDLGIVLSLPAQRLAGRLHRGLGAAQAQEQAALAAILYPAAGVERQRLSAPVVEPLQRLRLAALEAQRGLARCLRQHLEADFGDQAQCAPGAGHQPRDVVAGDILHHLAAKAQQLGAAVEKLHAQHIVAHRAHAGPRRAAQARGNHAADGRARGKMRRIERQALAVVGEQRLQLGQRSAGTRGHDQLAGLVADHAPQFAGVDDLPGQRSRMKVLAAAAAQAQRGLVGNGGAHALGDLAEG